MAFFLPLAIGIILPSLFDRSFYVIPVLVVINIWLAGVLFRHMMNNSRRASQRTGPQALARDGRPPIVFLRSFALYKARIKGSHDVFGTRNRGSFEAVLMNRLWRAGPVIYVARPAIHSRLGEGVLDEEKGVIRFQRGRKKYVEAGTVAPGGASLAFAV